MTELLATLLNLSQETLFLGFAVFLRVGAAMASLPAFGEQALSVRVRLALALAFTAVVFLPASAQLRPLVGLTGLPLWMLGEVAIGLLIGLLLRLFVLALQVAGTIAAQATSLSQLFGGSTGEPQPAIGHLMVMGGLALAVKLGLPVQLSALLIGSYSALPPGALPDAELVRSWGLSGVSHTFELAFTIAAPFVLAGLIYNVALGAINRAMPQLMVAFVGAPALTLGGLILLALALPTGLMVWHGAFAAFLANPYQVVP